MTQVKLLKRGGGPQRDDAARSPAERDSGPDLVRLHRASPPPVPTLPASAHGEQAQRGYVTVGMVLLSAVAVVEGYRCLNIIPAGRADLAAPVFALLAVPAALFLARAHQRSWHAWPTRLVVMSAVALIVATVLDTVVDRLWSNRVLGASDLLMAVTVLVSALIGGRRFAP